MVADPRLTAVRDEDADNSDAGRAVVRVRAASRAHDGTWYVCPLGWSTEVFELTGAAGAVWASLEESDDLDDVARRCGVDRDDEFLVASVQLLTDAHLVRRGSQN